MHDTQGSFIVFEGIDGSGKSTQAALLAQHLLGEGIPCVQTREPTDSPAGRLIRSVLTGELRMNPLALPGLFAADRMEHLLGEGGICQTLSEGKNVLCDRYYFSSYAYHSLDAPMDWVIGMNSEAARVLRPAVTVFIDVSPEEAIRRIRQGRDHTELFEKLEMLRRIRENYFTAFEKMKLSENVAVVDGNRPEEDVAAEILRCVSSCFH